MYSKSGNAAHTWRSISPGSILPSKSTAPLFTLERGRWDKNQWIVIFSDCNKLCGLIKPRNNPQTWQLLFHLTVLIEQDGFSVKFAIKIFLYFFFQKLKNCKKRTTFWHWQKCHFQSKRKKNRRPIYKYSIQRKTVNNNFITTWKWHLASTVVRALHSKPYLQKHFWTFDFIHKWIQTECG